MWRTALAVFAETTGRPATAPSVLNSATGFNSPSSAKMVYARASCTRLTERPWPYDIVACSIGFHVFGGRRRPATSPGNPVFGADPNPDSENIRHSVSEGSDNAIFAAPTFDDFWITCSTVSGPALCASWIVLGPIFSAPSSVWITVSGRTLPASRAAAIVNGFIVEPGSNVSVSVRLRIFSRATLSRRFGLYVGQFASARISPDRKSTRLNS